MKRDTWEFRYNASEVAAQARRCVKHHEERLVFWCGIYDATVLKIKADGITVSESAAGLSYLSNTGRNVEVVINPEYRKDLFESDQKRREHEEKIREYQTFAKALELNPTAEVNLTIDDINFFFRFEE